MGIQIKLNDINRSYFAGQTVEGQVIIHSTNLDKVRGVVISLEGLGLVHWTRNVPGAGNVHYNSQETYVSSTISLADDGENQIILPEGTTTYPFHFDLPTNIPSSFNSQFGRVSYVLRVEIKRSALKLNDRAHLPFTVNGILDLNIQAGASSPQEHKMMKGSILSRKELNVQIRIPNRSGFVPGEVINFTAEIANDTKKKVKSIKASLTQVTKLYSEEGESKTLTKICNQLDGPDMTEKKNVEWTGNLYVPPVPPTKLGGNCRIIDVKYYLHFEMKTSGLDNSLSGEIPVIIGTIPLRSTFGSVLQAQSTFPSTSPSPFTDYPDLPPPSYVEAMSTAATGSVLIQGAGGYDSIKCEGVHEHDTIDNQAVSKISHENEIPNSVLSGSLSTDEFGPKYVTYMGTYIKMW